MEFIYNRALNSFDLRDIQIHSAYYMIHTAAAYPSNTSVFHIQTARDNHQTCHYKMLIFFYSFSTNS